MTRSQASRIGTMNATSNADSAPGGPGERGPHDRRRCPSHPGPARARSSQPIGGSPTRSAFCLQRPDTRRASRTVKVSAARSRSALTSCRSERPLRWERSFRRSMIFGSGRGRGSRPSGTPPRAFLEHPGITLVDVQMVVTWLPFGALPRRASGRADTERASECPEMSLNAALPEQSRP